MDVVSGIVKSGSLGHVHAHIVDATYGRGEGELHCVGRIERTGGCDGTLLRSGEVEHLRAERKIGGVVFVRPCGGEAVGVALAARDCEHVVGIVHGKKVRTMDRAERARVRAVVVGERDGKLVSNYLAFKYNDELREEWERIFYGRFPCSDYEVSAYSQMNRKELLYPVKDISAEKFIDKYMEYDCFLILYYDDESQIPSENEMKEYILDLVDDEPHPYSISIFYCDSKYDRDEVISNYNVEYHLYMTDDDTIKSLNVSYNGDTSKNHSLI